MSIAKRPRPFRTPLLRLDRAVLFAGLEVAEGYFERARVADIRREQCVYELRAISILRDTYLEAGLVQGGEA
jgi:hypothetical protein